MTLSEKAVKVAVAMLERRGMEDVEETGGVFQLTYYDPEDEARCFAAVGIGDGSMPGLLDEGMRNDAEECAMSWLSEHSVGDFSKVRFDGISMKEVSSDRFFVRHEKNCLGGR